MTRVRRASDGANELDANIEWGMVAVRAVDTGVRADHFWSLLFVCDAVRTMFTAAHVKQTTERLERLERKFDGLLLAISSLKAQRQSRRRSVTSERQRQRRSARADAEA